MGLTKQLSPAGLSLLQQFMSTLTPLSPLPPQVPPTPAETLFTEITPLGGSGSATMVSKAPERVNSQGFPAFR